MDNLPYDKTSPQDIERYAKKLVGKTFYNVLEEEFHGNLLEEKAAYYDNPRGKGSLGNLLEEHYFFYQPNSESEPDFAEAGTELKVTPYEITKKGKHRAGERLVIGMIPNSEPIEEDFYESHLLRKMRLILLIFYLRSREKRRTEYSIDYVTLFSILSEKYKEDLMIIKDDYRRIVEKIKAGKAHELSEGDTRYLGACTKGSTAERSLQPQFYNDSIPAKRRAFSLKQSYMSYLINHYLLQEAETADAAFSQEELERMDFEAEVIRRIDQYEGKTEEELCRIFGIASRSKQTNHLIVSRMLGVKTDNVAEFEKADIEIKTIRVQKNGKPKESMSFPVIKIKQFVSEEFENSRLYRFFSEKRFLFVVFREREDGEFALSGARFWNMPVSDLETTGRKEWEAYQQKFMEGVEFTIKERPDGGYRVLNDLPTTKTTKIFHLRPHASRSAYEIDGQHIGNGTEADMDTLPDGRKMTKQCFWLNKDYVAKIIKEI